MTYVLLAVNSFVYVFLKALQQRNVSFNDYSWIMPVSLGMATTEVFLISTVAVRGMDLITVLAVGIPSGTGALLAMRLHNFLKRKHHEPTDIESSAGGPPAGSPSEVSGTSRAGPSEGLRPVRRAKPRWRERLLNARLRPRSRQSPR